MNTVSKFENKSFIPDSIAGLNRSTFNKLLVSIEAGIDTLQIFIGICDADRQREQLIEKFSLSLAPEMHTYRVQLDSQEPSLRLAVEQVTNRQKAIAMVIGAESLGLGKDDPTLDRFFGYLQWTREGMRALNMPIVLWIPSRIHTLISRKAPDFYSWRNGIFHFEPEVDISQNSTSIPQQIFDRELTIASAFTPEQMESSLAKVIARWGKDSSEAEPLYAQLGNLYAERIKNGKCIEREQEIQLAEDYLNQAIAIQTKEDRLISLATTLNDLGGLRLFLGKYNEAEPLYLGSLQISEQQLGAEHPNTAQSLNNLAELYRSQGRYSEAEPLLLRSLQIREQQLGADHPDTAQSLNNLAGLYESQGRYSEAEPLYLRSLSIYEQQLGADHPNTAGSLNNLAGLYESQGRYSEAEPLYSQALQIFEKTLGKDHPKTIATRDNYAQCLKQIASLSK